MVEHVVVAGAGESEVKATNELSERTTIDIIV